MALTSIHILVIHDIHSINFTQNIDLYIIFICHNSRHYYSYELLIYELLILPQTRYMNTPCILWDFVFHAVKYRRTKKLVFKRRVRNTIKVDQVVNAPET